MVENRYLGGISVKGGIVVAFFAWIVLMILIGYSLVSDTNLVALFFGGGCESEC